MIKNKILLLGANGFIGKHIAEELYKKKIPNVITHTRKELNVPNNISYQYDSRLFIDFLTTCKLIINCTGLGLSKLYQSSITNEKITNEINKAIILSKNNTIKIIHFSSFKAYNPTSYNDIYSRDKFNCELLFYKSNLINRTCILRIPAVLGPNDKNMLPLKIMSMICNIPYIDNSKTLPPLNFIGVSRLAEILVEFIYLDKIPFGGIFYIKNKKDTNWNELVSFYKNKKIQKFVQVSDLKKIYTRLKYIDRFFSKRKFFPKERFNDLFFIDWIVEKNDSIIIHETNQSLKEALN